VYSVPALSDMNYAANPAVKTRIVCWYALHGTCIENLWALVDYKRQELGRHYGC